MAVSFGFYNSLVSADGKRDREYTAEEMGALFDGILNDGIYEQIGDRFAVTPSSNGMAINVGTGRAWFKNTWTLNDSKLRIEVPASDLLLSRIDVVVIEVNKSLSVRANAIRIVSGEKGSSPSRPTLKKGEGGIWQFALADILVKPGVNSVTEGDITNVRGTTETPWVTGPLKTMDASDLYAQWSAQFNTWLNDTTRNTNNKIESLINGEGSKFRTWFAQLQQMLNSNQAAYLAAEIVKINNMLEGFHDDPTLYDMLLDSSRRPVLDSNRTAIDGRIIYKKV